jgi:hypothetical protein
MPICNNSPAGLSLIWICALIILLLPVSFFWTFWSPTNPRRAAGLHALKIVETKCPCCDRGTTTRRMPLRPFAKMVVLIIVLDCLCADCRALLHSSTTWLDGSRLIWSQLMWMDLDPMVVRVNREATAMWPCPAAGRAPGSSADRVARCWGVQNRGWQSQRF